MASIFPRKKKVGLLLTCTCLKFFMQTNDKCTKEIRTHADTAN